MNLYSSLVDSAVKMDFRKENFANPNTGIAIGFLMVGLIILFVDTYIIFFIWNNVLTKLVTFVRPMRTLWQSLGILLLAMIIHG